MKKILVAIDGSNASVKAAKKAVDLAQKYGSEITFLTVTHIPSHPDSYLAEYNSPELVKLVEERAENEKKERLEKDQKMLDAVVESLDLSGIQTHKKVVTGVAHEVIIETAETGGYDLIVMGRRGLSNFKRLFVGSVTQRVLADAPCCVFVVKE
jgi:nucleotide-binding universal stress UspA family protein